MNQPHPPMLRENSRWVTCIVIGAGQAGLAMSHCLSSRGIDHVVLEKGEIANAWKTQRWDSLKLLSPNWQTRLVGYSYQGSDPDGFMTAAEYTSYLMRYADTLSAPIHTDVNVEQVSSTQNGYRVLTNQGEWQCKSLVMATGACAKPAIPKFANELPASIEAITPYQYKSPEQLADGGVLIVGASASGLQIASEIQQSGRQVIIATGEQVRMPRRYRGKDIQFWLDKSGLLSHRYDEVEDLERLRRLPSAQLVGSDDHRNLDLNLLQDEGAEVVGRLALVQGSKLQFSGSLANMCKMADLKMGRMLRLIDDFIRTQGLEREVPVPDAPDATRVTANPRLEMDLHREGIKTVVWATGFRPDFSWLKVPVIDPRGRLKHEGGVVHSPGLYVLGLPFMRRRNSQFIDGVAKDAQELAQHMEHYLHHNWRQSQVSVA